MSMARAILITNVMNQPSGIVGGLRNRPRLCRIEELPNNPWRVHVR